MKVEKQLNDNCTLNLTIEVDAERVQAAMRTTAREYSRHYQIPGFRPGKAPYATVLRHVGEKELYSAALEDLLQKVLEEALRDEKIELYGQPELLEKKDDPLTLTFLIPLAPEVALGDYRSIRVSYTPPSVTDDRVAEVMERMREHYAVVAPVERAAALGDVVTAEVKAYLNAGENPSDFLLAEQNMQVTLSSQPADEELPGLHAQLTGLSAGESKKFEVTFPEDYANTSLRGQVAHVEVQCKEVKSRTLPEWNDELARQAGAESLETLRTQARTDLEAAAQRQAAEDYENQVAEKLVEQATVKFPPNLLEMELDELLEDFDKRLQREQRLHLDDYLKVENKTKEQLREEFRPAAEKRLRNGLVLSEVADQEKLTVAAREVQAQLDGLAQRFGMDAKAARQLATSEDLRRSLSNTLLTRRVLEWLAQSAKGELETPPVPAAEVEAATPTPSE